MRTFIVITAMALLAGCGGMRMQSGGSASPTQSSGASGTSDYGQDANERDRIFNSYVGGP